MGCLGDVSHPWGCFRTLEMWHLGTRSVGTLGWIRVGLGDLGGFVFQPE